MAQINDDERRNRLNDEIQPDLVDTQNALQTLSKGDDDALKLAADIAEQNRQREYNAAHPKVQQSPIGVVDPSNPNSVYNEHAEQQTKEQAKQAAQAAKQQAEQARQQQAASRRQQRFGQRAKSVQDAYNEFVDLYGREPDNKELNAIMAGNRWAYQSVYLPQDQLHGARAQTVLGMGGIFSDMDQATREALRKGYNEYKGNIDATKAAARRFSARGEDGSLIAPEGGQAPQSYQLYADANSKHRATAQDIKALNAIMREPASPERDAQLTNAMRNYFGVELDGKGTIQEQINRFLDQDPVKMTGEKDSEFQARVAARNAQRDALGILLRQSGATIDENGDVVLPANMSPEEMEADIRRRQQRQREIQMQMQQAALERAKGRAAFAELANVVGDMIQASGGAKVLPRDRQKAYDSLTDRQQKLYDAYWAWVDAQNDKADKAKQHKDDLDAAAEEAEKNRKAKEKQHQDDIAARKWEVNRNISFHRDKDNQPKYTLDFGYGTEPIHYNQADGESVLPKIYGYMVEAGAIPAEAVPSDIKMDRNGNLKAVDRTAAMKEIVVLVGQYWDRLSKRQLEHLYFLATGKSHAFRTEEEVRADLAPQTQPEPEPEPWVWNPVTGFNGGSQPAAGAAGGTQSAATAAASQTRSGGTTNWDDWFDKNK